MRMRVSMIFVGLLMALVSVAATYRPNGHVRNYITVRSEARASASEIGRIQKSETFEVEEVSRGWGKVIMASGSIGYVNAKYIEEVIEVQPESVPHKSGAWKGGTVDLHWMVWLILALVTGVFILQKCDLDSEVSIWVTPIMWLLLGVAELVYIICCADPFWTGEHLAWWVILIAVVGFALAAFYQTGSMIAFAKTYSENNAAVGIWSVPVCVVGAIVLYYTVPDYVAVALVAFALAQLWQAFVIFRTVGQYQGPGLAFVSAVGYLFGMLGTLVMATLLVALVVVVVVAILCLWLVLTIIGSDTKDIRLTHKWGSYFTDQYGDEWEHIGGNTYRRT